MTPTVRYLIFPPPQPRLPFQAPMTQPPPYTAARRKLDDDFAPRVNTTFEVYRFRQTKQLENESLGAFYARLRQLLKHCDFVDADTKIKNQILLSTTSTRLRRYAMQHDLDLQGILKQARLFEEVEQHRRDGARASAE
ncbi:hypothetical protein MTO96_029414 [Rhipicephalus appendiculatus]